jgi:hypothetical protein
MGVDFRTRRDDEVRDVGFTAFFTGMLPGLLEENASCIEPWLARNCPDNLSIECEGAAWQLSGDLNIVRGEMSGFLNWWLVIRALVDPIEALIKPLHVVEGISDLPWHKDCSLGRHSYECYSLTLGIDRPRQRIESAHQPGA